MRAFTYFYLVNLFGEVPLATSTDPKLNAQLSRSSVQSIYEQIIKDLTDAKDLLSYYFPDGNLQPYSGVSERLRPTKWAAASLLARVYLYTNDFTSAEGLSTEVINNNSLFGLETLSNVFLKNSKEAIWQLQPVRSDRNTEDAFAYIITSTGLSDVNGYEGNPVYLSSILLNSFEANDKRRNGEWVDSIDINGTTYYYSYKYKATLGNVTEYLMVLHLAEQYLIRAEARAQLGNFGGAQMDLNAIRTRAGLGATNANDKESLLSAILHERQVELFTEWGHRWLDLKRTGNVDAVMSVVTPLKGGSWQTTDQLYPLPFSDLQKDPNLRQNAGY